MESTAPSTPPLNSASSSSASSNSVSSNRVTSASAAAGTRSPAEIERDLEATRERLASNIDLLAARVHPKAVAKRSTDKAKVKAVEAAGQAQVVAADTATKARALAVEYVAKAKLLGQESAQRAKGELVDTNGSPRPDRLAAVGAVAATVIGLVVWRRRR